eukprot:scaffold399098_cov29-Prasinocladus_malaysianus.AAC.1
MCVKTTCHGVVRDILKQFFAALLVAQRNCEFKMHYGVMAFTIYKWAKQVAVEHLKMLELISSARCPASAKRLLGKYWLKVIPKVLP